MNKYESSFSSILTYPNSNDMISNENYIKRKNEKKVTFNNKIEIFDVESYKALNKKLTFNEEEGLAELQKSLPYGFNGKFFGLSQKYFSTNANPNCRRNVDPECCCLII